MTKKRTVEHVLPASNPRFIEKAAQSDAEILFLDLEDAVATSVKVAARQVLVDAVKTTDFRGKEIYVRPNNLRTKWAAGDYCQVVRAIGDKITGVTLPKIVGLEDIKVVDSILIAIERENSWKRGSLKIEALIELPSALEEVEEIAAYIRDCGRAGSLIFGLVDYTAATGGRPQAQEDQFLFPLYPKKRIVEAARQFGLDSFDGVTIHVKNYEATKKDAILSSRMGFTGKWSLHPEQIRAIHDADGECSFTESRIDAATALKTNANPFSLDDLKKLAEEEKPILAPLQVSLKKAKARRSVWIFSQETAPSEIDDRAANVLSVNTPEELKRTFSRVPQEGGVWVKIETDQALQNAYALAKCSNQIEALIFDIPGKKNDLEAKGALLAACAAADIDAIDGPGRAGRGEEEANQAAILGFSGKVALSVNEAAIFNKIFSPPPEAIERALEVVELYHKADVERGLGAIVYVDNRRANAQEELVDAATVKVEKRVLAVAEKAKLFTAEQAERYAKLIGTDTVAQGLSPKGTVPDSGATVSVPSSRSSIQSVSILGAGEIGAPLAARMARCGVKVQLATLHLDTLAKAEKKIRASLEFRAKEATGILALEKKLAKAATPEEKSFLEAKIKELGPQMRERVSEWLANIKTTQDPNYLSLIKTLSAGRPDLVIECTREELLTKQAILRAWTKELDASVVSGNGETLPIVATTTSSLLLADIATHLPASFRKRFIDFHPFNPPDRMDLLEVAYTKDTEPQVVDEVIHFAKTLELDPVLVKDSCGLIVNRVLFAYLGEAVNILAKREASLEQIVAAAYDFGFPMDPFRLLDFVGLDVSEAIIANLNDKFSDHIQPANPFFKRLLGLGRYGNKTQKGFYSYKPVIMPTPDKVIELAGFLRLQTKDVESMIKLGLEATPGNVELLSECGLSFTDCERLAALLAKSKATLDAEILESFRKFQVVIAGPCENFDPLRLPLVMVNEGARLVQEGTASVADVDLAMDLGTRFPQAQGLGARVSHGVFALSKARNQETLKSLYAAKKSPKLVTAGPFGWLLNFGVEKVLRRLEVLSHLYGALYKPCAFLKALKWNLLPKPDSKGVYPTSPYKRAVVKPKGVRGPAAQVFEEGLVPTRLKLGAFQLRGHVIVADINANWKWGVRDYPIDLSKYHQETATVGGSAGLILVTEVGAELAQFGSIKPGDIGIMLSGKHDVITTEALGGSAQAHRSFRIHAYEAKDAFEGSYSQEVVLDWCQFVKVDEGVYKFEELGGVGLVYPTIQHALNVLTVAKDDVVLIEGVLGGTGAAAALAAKSRNAKVIGLVSSEERGKKALELYGIDAYINRKKCASLQDYLSEIKAVVKQLSPNKQWVDKVIAYSGQGMFGWHAACVRETDPQNAHDIGGKVAYFGAGETGFSLEVKGTAAEAPIAVMFERLARVRRERYLASSMRHVLILGAPSLRLHEAIEEAKKRHCDVIVVVKTSSEEKEVWRWNLLAREGWRKGAKSRDGVIVLESSGVSLERMPDFPRLLADAPTDQEVKDFENAGTAYQAYMRRSLIPLGKAIGGIWGFDSSGRPLCPDVDVVLWDGPDGENILNYLMFSGFFTQIAYPNDTAAMNLRWHAGLGWMSQNSILLSRKAILGTHYANPAESTSIVDWLMRGVVVPTQTRSYWPWEIGEAQETIGTGKNVILAGVSRPGLKTVKAAYELQDLDHAFECLQDESPHVRLMAARELYGQGCLLVEGVLKEWNRYPELRDLIFGPPTVGLACYPKRFERIRQAWGLPDLSPIPAEHQALEFALHEQGLHLDVMAPVGEGGALSEYLIKHGKGIQQVELFTSDIKRVMKVLGDIGLKPIYDSPRLGSHQTLVNFVLARASESKKLLIELVQLNTGTKLAGRKRVISDLDIRVFAKASGDRNPFHLDDAYAKATRYGGRIAHGVLTCSFVMSDLGEALPCLAVEGVEVSKFSAPVKIGDLVVPQAEVVEARGEQVNLKISALNQEGTVLFEGALKGRLTKESALCSLQDKNALRSWAERWCRDVEAFAVRSASEFKIGDQALLKGTDPESKSLMITQESLLAFGLLFGPDNPSLAVLMGIGAVAHTSAMAAPGYILIGFKTWGLKRAFKEGDVLTAKARVEDVQTTKSGKTIIRVEMDILDSRGDVLLKGEVTKLKAEQAASAPMPKAVVLGVPGPTHYE